MTACRNCGCPIGDRRARALCWHCYERPEIRERFPVRPRWPACPITMCCCHCGWRKSACRSRGLCPVCFSDLSIRALYPLPSSESKPKPVVCRCCQKGKVSRPRGLCWSCYRTPGNKELFPSTSKYGRRRDDDDDDDDDVRDLPLAPESTAARPGSPEKIEVLAKRAELGFALWHPLDATMEPSTM